MERPGVGPPLASAIVATVPDPAIFRSGRNLAAWIGLVPRQNSSGGKERLGGIAKAGHQCLCQMLIGENQGRSGSARQQERRMIWAMMNSGERHREPLVASGIGAGNHADEVGKGEQKLMQQAG